MRSILARVLFFAAAAVAAATPALAGQVTYAVVPEDTLSSIAARYHLSVAAVESRNHLTDTSVLQIGQTILIRETVAPAHPRSVSSVRRHTRPRAVGLRRPATGNAARNALWVATHTGQAPPPPAPVSFSLAEQIVAFDAKLTHTALRYVGVPYVWGGTSFNGVDCSGFVQAVFEHNGIELPRTADSQFEVGKSVKLADLRAGDLVFFETYAAGASHVGIYLGSGRFVHASSSNGVRVDMLSEDYYAIHYIGARRLNRESH